MKVRAAQSGIEPEDVLDQVMTIHEQFGNDDWPIVEGEAIAAQIEEGFAQAERGELIDPEEAIRILRSRRAGRQAV